MVAPEGLPKYERICKENDIDLLFAKGAGVSVYPYRVIFLFHRDELRPATVRLLVSVSKKRFHHAIKRNRVKPGEKTRHRFTKSVNGIIFPSMWR